MANVSVEPVPQAERTPNKRYQVIVDGSIISRHRTRNKARERAREAKGAKVDRTKTVSERAIEASKVGTPVDATLETMGGGNMAEFVTSNSDEREPAPEEAEPDPWANVVAMAMGSAGETDNDGPDDTADREGNSLTMADPFNLGMHGGENNER